MTTVKQDQIISEQIDKNVGYDVTVGKGTDWGWLIDLIARNMTPDEVFADKDLEQWAEENGYTKAE
jgi:hypothetical protein